MSDRYVLDEAGINPVRCDDINEWGKWFEQNPKRRVARETVGDCDVSTVFLATDHAWGGPPMLWETMVFGGTMDQEQDRCGGNREQAEAMHAAMVARVKESQQVKA